MSNGKITLGFIGFGCVGQGVYDNIQRYYPSQIEVKRICVKQPGKLRKAPAHLFTYDVSEIINDPDIALTVEATDDARVAEKIISAGLKAGKDLVTANKAAVAQNLEHFVTLQKITGRTLLYEAAAAAAVPVIRVLETQYGQETVESLDGILNGSTNYLLSKMRLKNLSFEEALAEAQQKGFAETDPRLDIDGWDAAHKIVILAAHAFGRIISVDEVRRTTFNDFLESSFNPAKNQKCIASARIEHGRVKCSVDFKDVNFSSPFSQIEYEKNAVNIYSAIGGENLLTGAGAGADATAAAILADIFQWQAGIRYQYQKYSESMFKKAAV